MYCYLNNIFHTESFQNDIRKRAATHSRIMEREAAVGENCITLLIGEFRSRYDDRFFTNLFFPFLSHWVFLFLPQNSDYLLYGFPWVPPLSRATYCPCKDMTHYVALIKENRKNEWILFFLPQIPLLSMWVEIAVISVVSDVRKKNV